MESIATIGLIRRHVILSLGDIHNIFCKYELLIKTSVNKLITHMFHSHGDLFNHHYYDYYDNLQTFMIYRS